MDPLTIAAIAGVVGKLFSSKAAKSRNERQDELDRQHYNDEVNQWLQAQQAAEEDRQRKISLYTAFAKGNNLDSALTPEILAQLAKPKPIVQPPPYRSNGGTPGFGWDIAGILAGGAGSIYASHAASKLNPSDIIKKARLGVPSAGFSPGFNPAAFGSSVQFGGPATWKSPWG